eukprot:321761-Prymnesium_polylepis.1
MGVFCSVGVVVPRARTPNTKAYVVARSYKIQIRLTLRPSRRANRPLHLRPRQPDVALAQPLEDSPRARHARGRRLLRHDLPPRPKPDLLEQVELVQPERSRRPERAGQHLDQQRVGGEEEGVGQARAVQPEQDGGPLQPIEGARERLLLKVDRRALGQRGR